MVTFISGVLSDGATCYQCGVDISGWTGTDGEAPEAGDASICMNCGALLIFSADSHKFIRPDDDTLSLMLLDPNVVEAIRVIKSLPKPSEQESLDEFLERMLQRKMGEKH